MKLADSKYKNMKWGFGAIVIDDPSSVWVQPEDYLRLITTVVKDIGVTYLDTAQAYGIGEQTLGEWVKNNKSLAEKLVIGSKVSGIDYDEDTSHLLTSDYVFQTAKRSCEKINLRPLDIYWLHGPDNKTPFEETFKGFDRVVREGLANEIGISNVTKAEVKEILLLCEKYNLIKPKYIQNEFNLFEHNLEELNFFKGEGFKFMAYSPLAGGILTGKYGYEEIPSKTRWGHWQKSRGLPSYWTQENFAKMEKLKQFAKELNISLAGLCLAWVSAHVDTTLVGPKNETQMVVVKEAQSFEMDPKVLGKISELILI